MTSHAPHREKPPNDRRGITRKVTLRDADNEPVDFYLTLNKYPDGRPCELFIKASAGYQGWCDCVARLFSLCLQTGSSIACVCHQLERAGFPPCGIVAGEGYAASLPDFIARWAVKERAP